MGRPRDAGPMLGLDNAGKTTILRMLCGEATDTVAPTQGFNIKSFQDGEFKLNIWDIRGQQAIRQYWSHYLEACDALIFVVDSTDKARFDESSTELKNLLQEEKLKAVPVLIFANKQDLPGCATAEDVSGALNLAAVEQTYVIQACSAKTGDGVLDGMQQLGTAVSS